MLRACLLIALAVFSLSAGAYLWRAEAPSEFVTVPVGKGPIATFVKATGNVDAVTTVEVSSQLSGRISEVFVSFNEQVQAGQPIAQVDPEIFKARVNEAKAALLVARANTQLQEAAVRRSKAVIENAGITKKMAELQLMSSKASYDDLERDYQRNLKLVQTNAVSDRDFTSSRTKRDAAGISVQTQTEDIRLKALAVTIAEAEDAMAEANLHNAAAVVEQRQAALEQARLDLERTIIRTPIGGVIIKRDVNPGQTVAVTLEAKTLFKIAHDLREMELRGRIDEADVGKLQVGQGVNFTVDAYPEQVFRGRVIQIRKSPEVVQNVVTYTALISAPNPELLLLPGMTAVLRIVIEETEAALRIPNQALRFKPPPSLAAEYFGSAVGRGDGIVWVVADSGKLRSVRVKLGTNDENFTQARDDKLKEGDQLVVGTKPGQRRLAHIGLRLGF